MNETPLTRWHQQHGARMTDFHGWLMPIQYTSITDEHLAVRRAAGIFDLCHMGRVRLSGADHLAFAYYVTTADVKAMVEGQVDYGFLCNPRGGIVDDITVYRNSDDILLVVNGANRLKVIAWLTANRGAFGVEIEDASDRLGMIAIQGPQAVPILQKMTRFPLNAIRYYHFVPAEVVGVAMLVSRTGYTGEDGFELYLNSKHCLAVWDKLMTPDKKLGDLIAVGLGARDTLRLEAAMPLYGNELNDTTTPFEAGLGKFVRLDKEDFVGRAALLRSYNAPARRLCCLVMDEKSVPRSGYKIFSGETAIGEVTSGTFSPTLHLGIAMAYVNPAYVRDGTPLAVEIRGRKCPARVIRRPFYSRKKSK